MDAEKLLAGTESSGTYWTNKNDRQNRSPDHTLASFGFLLAGTVFKLFEDQTFLSNTPYILKRIASADFYIWDV